MVDLIRLIRNNECTVKYDSKFNMEWSDNELLSHIIVLDCSNNQLTNLPELLNCTELYCRNNRLTNLPDLPNCIKLDCFYNRLTNLSDLPNCIELDCSHNHLTNLPKLLNCIELYCHENQLTYLPELSNCELLCCFNNQLTNLPELPKCKYLYCDNNNLSFTTLEENKKIWKFKRFYLRLKYFKLFYKRMLQSLAKKKYDLHLELKYSPNLSFYKEDSYYKHFIQTQNMFKINL